jgi:hypothetical protein
MNSIVELAKCRVADEQNRAIVALLEATTHSIIWSLPLSSPDRTHLLDKLREVKESFGIVEAQTNDGTDLPSSPEKVQPVDPGQSAPGV